ncbi:MAG: phosphocholine cytidylyltransferase family protein, partial [Muribaculum sp.]|nr:phosphocholine cytidylyltransferase family protein [Muribaculum sp.]
MQAIILAAGMGRRLGSLTAENTKCMVKVNGTCLIDRMLRQLKSLKLDRVVVVTGYEGERLRRHIENIPTDHRPPTVFIDNPDYATTNNIHSLWIARDYLASDDTLLLESDIILDDGILQTLVESEWSDVALVDKYQPWMDGTMVRIDPTEGHIVSFVPKKAFRYADIDSYYKTVNVYKLSQTFTTGQYLPFLDAYIRAMGQNEYYEQVLRVLTTIDSTSLKALPLPCGSRWYEIDDIQD